MQLSLHGRVKVTLLFPRAGESEHGEGECSPLSPKRNLDTPGVCVIVSAGILLHANVHQTRLLSGVSTRNSSQFQPSSIRRSSGTVADAPVQETSSVFMDEVPEPGNMTSPVCSHNEWDPLEEIIVGRIEGAHVPPLTVEVSNSVYTHVQYCFFLLFNMTREKSFCKTSFQLGMGLKKVQKQGRDGRMQEDYQTSAKIHSRCRVVFLHTFISTLFLYLFSPSLTEMKFYRNFCCAGDKRVENARSNLSPPPPQLSNRTYLEMIATLGYSPSKTGGSYHALILTSELVWRCLTIHAKKKIVRQRQTTSEYATPTIYAIAFSAGLNGLQVN